MGQYAGYAQLAGSLLGAFGQVQQGQDQGRASRFEARQLERQANQVQGAATRAAAERERESRFLQSQLIARAAASGGGVTNLNVSNLYGDLAQEGRYRALVDLYEGYQEGAKLRTGANVARYEGKSAQSAGIISGLSSIVGSGATFYSKYSGGIKPYNPLSEGETYAHNQGILGY